MAPGTAATAGAGNSDSSGLSHYISPGGPSQTTDSAYNSEHEHTPEQQDGEQPKSKNPEFRIAASPLQPDLWRAFNKVGNEMIVTKPGR